MKTSNKLLIGGIIAIILLIASIHISLSAKYKNGQYTSVQRQDKSGSAGMEQFTGIKKIRIQDVQELRVQCSDKAGIEKNKKGVTYTQVGDSLVLMGKPGEWVALTITIPLNCTIDARGTALYLDSTATALFPQWELQLLNSSLEVTGPFGGNLSIVTDTLSKIALPAKLLLKTKITSTAN